MEVSWKSTPSRRQYLILPICVSHLSISVTPHASMSVHVFKFVHVAIVFLLVVIALCINLLRRKLSRFAVLTTLPLPASASVISRPRSRPPAPARPDKAGYRYLPGVAEEDYSGASSSNMHAPPQYSQATRGIPGDEQDHQFSGRRYPAPPEYGLAPGVEIDDDLAERIAQRVARIVQGQSPPGYEGPASADH